MSIDYSIACERCKVYHHLGQHMAAKFSLGYGTGDEKKTAEIGDFILEHADHQSLRLHKTDDIPEDHEDVEVYS
jgi:hypothetical protein